MDLRKRYFICICGIMWIMMSCIFRDYLKGNPAAAKEYEALKLSLWKKYEHNRDAYTDAKSEFVKECTEKAKLDHRGWTG